MFLFFFILFILEIVSYILFLKFCGLSIAFITFIITSIYGLYILTKQHQKLPHINTENINQTNTFHNITLYVAGILLIMPGLITDIIGFLLTFHIIRVIFQEVIVSFMQNHPIHYMMVLSKKVNRYKPPTNQKNHYEAQETEKIIEGNFEILHDNDHKDQPK